MPKPGQMTNLPNPERSQDASLADVASVAMGSRQDASTAQTANSSPYRMIPNPRAPSKEYPAEVDRDGVLDNQTADRSASTRANYGNRDRIFNKPGT